MVVKVLLVEKEGTLPLGLGLIEGVVVVINVEVAVDDTIFEGITETPTDELIVEVGDIVLVGVMLEDGVGEIEILDVNEIVLLADPVGDGLGVLLGVINDPSLKVNFTS